MNLLPLIVWGLIIRFAIGGKSKPEAPAAAADVKPEEVKTPEKAKDTDHASEPEPSPVP